jgi:ATP-dependent DNA helicase RecG
VEISSSTKVSEFVKSKIHVNALKKLGVETIYELITYYPRRVLEPAVKVNNISDMKRYTSMKKCIFEATIMSKSAIPMKSNKGRRLELVLRDAGNRSIKAVFFAKNNNYFRWLYSKWDNGEKVIVIGIPQVRDSYQLVHPEIYTPKSTAMANEIYERHLKPQTLYAASAKISSSKISEIIKAVAQKLEGLNAVKIEDPWATEIKSGHIFPDVLPLKQMKFPSRWKALKAIHMPKDIQEYENAREQIKLEEAYILQCILMMNKADTQKRSNATPCAYIEGGLLDKFDMQIPFELTESQKSVHEIIKNDMAQKIPMQRLLQGDVGSGKTLVALRSMLLAVDSGKQAVLLAPTEVLASQHYTSILTILGKLAQIGIRDPKDKKVRVLLLTGSQKQREKDNVVADMKSGEADIIIGTHALLYHRDDLSNLGLVVVDEQHRFGVAQRDVLRSASSGVAPHLLVMTATPIPRSVAMLLFSDLEISVLYDMPTKRAKTETFVIDSSNAQYIDRMWERTREEIDAGRNVFVIVPRIDDSDLVNEYEEESDSEYAIARDIFEKLVNSGLTERITKSSASIAKMLESLSKQQQLKGVEIGVLHGRMNAQEKEKAMNDFISMRTPILLATTVVEVGIDVPNATAMIIMDSDKFGISTLHQLRGRIGRGEHKSICFLMTSSNYNVSDNTTFGVQRINAVANCADGFELAKIDLNLRGEGDILGASQSGARSSLKLLRVLVDRNIITRAYELAKQTHEEDPHYNNSPGLKYAIGLEIEERKKEYLEKT